LLTAGLRAFLAVRLPVRQPAGAGSRHVPAGRPAATLEAFISEVGGRVACLALSRDPNAKVTILMFPPGATEPAYVAKVPTTDVAARSVEREAAFLASVAGLDFVTVPGIIGQVAHLGRPVLVTTALPGRSMLAAYHTWHHTARQDSVGADYAAAGGWLARLQNATASGTTSLAAALDGVVDAIRDRFGDRQGLAADLASLDALRSRLDGYRVARSVVHGDFWPGNVLIRGGQVSGVVDWEMASTGGAARDLARFVIAYSMYLDRHTRPGTRVAGHPGLRAGRWGAGVEYAMNGTGWYPDLARGFMREGLERLGVPGHCWRDVLLADLAVMAAEADHAEFAWNHLMLVRRLREPS
jgi:aminoglycoside phosphotransferase